MIIRMLPMDAAAKVTYSPLERVGAGGMKLCADGSPSNSPFARGRMELPQAFVCICRDTFLCGVGLLLYWRAHYRVIEDNHKEFKRITDNYRLIFNNLIIHRCAYRFSARSSWRTGKVK